jgi:hypothetical protein
MSQGLGRSDTEELRILLGSVAPEPLSDIDGANIQAIYLPSAGT